MRIDPADGEGWGKGPQVITKDYTFYGTYSARMRVPDIRKAQKNLGAAAGLYVHDNDEKYGCSAIDFELRIADPTKVYLAAWTGKEGELNRISRTIDLATGTIIDCSYAAGATEKGKLTEVDAINGAVSEYGRKVGCPTPMNDRVVEIIHSIEQGKLKAEFSNVRFFE